MIDEITIHTIIFMILPGQVWERFAVLGTFGKLRTNNMTRGQSPSCMLCESPACSPSPETVGARPRQKAPEEGAEGDRRRHHLLHVVHRLFLLVDVGGALRGLGGELLLKRQKSA